MTSHRIGEKLGVFPEQLTFGPRTVLERQSPSLYERHAGAVHIRVVAAGDQWQGIIAVDRMLLPTSSLCGDPQRAADTLWCGMMNLLTPIVPEFLFDFGEALAPDP